MQTRGSDPSHATSGPLSAGQTRSTTSGMTANQAVSTMVDTIAGSTASGYAVENSAMVMVMAIPEFFQKDIIV